MPEVKKPKVPGYDVFGYCVKCGKYMITHQVVDGVYHQRFTPEYTTVMYLLSDQSKMRVAMCITCADTLTHSKEETDMIMEKVVMGWRQEIDNFCDWGEEKKKEYFNKYGKLKLVTRADGKEPQLIQKKFDEYKKKEKKK